MPAEQADGAPLVAPGAAVGQDVQPAQCGCVMQNESQQSCSLSRPPVAAQRAKAPVLELSTQLFL